MKKLSKIIIGITVSILLLIISFFILKHEAGEVKNQSLEICCNNNCFNLEIAADDKSRQLGLMYRESMSDNDGMLFVYNTPGIYSFWMKNTLIPLAGIRFDSGLKIVDIILMDPCKTDDCPSYIPDSEAQYVLELNQGLISEKGLLNIGDKCELVTIN